MKTLRIGVTRFPGTNCDYDVFTFVKEMGHQPQWLWHQDHFESQDVDAVIIPGGFSYGDYLRCGALAARAPVMSSVRECAQKGKPVLGICNGFQILCEAQLLPGALLKNAGGAFVDAWVDLKCVNDAKTFGHELSEKKKISLPVAHGDGRYMVESLTLEQMKDRGQIWLQYVGRNPNGSIENIAGVMNTQKNVMALMPHPERALWDWAGGIDGRLFL